MEKQKEKLLDSSSKPEKKSAAAAGGGDGSGEKKSKYAAHDWRNHTTTIAGYIAVSAFDLLTVCLLYESVHDWDADWGEIFEFANFTSFRHDVVDAFWTCVVRIILITVLGISAVRAGTPDFENPPPSLLRALSIGRRNRNAKAAALAGTASINDGPHNIPPPPPPAVGTIAVGLPDKDSKSDEIKEPLLATNGNGNSDSKSEANGHGGGGGRRGGRGGRRGGGGSGQDMNSVVSDQQPASTITPPASAATTPPSTVTHSTTTAGGSGIAADLTEADRFLLTQDAIGRANIRIGILFMVTTASQVFLGIKMVSFTFASFDSPTVRAQAILMGLSIIWINSEWYYIRQIIELMTKEQGTTLRTRL